MTRGDRGVASRRLGDQHQVRPHLAAAAIVPRAAQPTPVSAGARLTGSPCRASSRASPQQTTCSEAISPDRVEKRKTVYMSRCRIISMSTSRQDGPRGKRTPDPRSRHSVRTRMRPSAGAKPPAGQPHLGGDGRATARAIGVTSGLPGRHPRRWAPAVVEASVVAPEPAGRYAVPTAVMRRGQVLPAEAACEAPQPTRTERETWGARLTGGVRCAWGR